MRPQNSINYLAETTWYPGGSKKLIGSPLTSDMEGTYGSVGEISNSPYCPREVYHSQVISNTMQQCV